MTCFPATTEKSLGLVIDLDTCVGCQACVTSCKEWNTGGLMAPLTDIHPYGGDVDGVWFNRVHTYEHKTDSISRTVNFPRSCLHCAEPACVTVCPTGASYKRSSDGIVLVDESKCIGCKLCSWACPYGAREYDTDVGVMKKCTLCVDRIYNENIPEEDRVPSLRRRLPDERAPLRRPRRSRIRGVEAGRGAQRGRADARTRLPPGQPISAATRARDAHNVHGRSSAAGCVARRRLPRLGRPFDVPLGRDRPMHPAYSVIFFTTATGAGYGLIALLGVLAAFGLVPPDFWFGLVSLGLALTLIGSGLLSSSAHLGNPQRAWRAFSQWRSSWLSREGCAAIITFVPAGLFALGWIIFGRTNGWVAVAGIVTALAAAVTVACTAMIYASLKPIAQWNSPFTLPAYLILSIMSGLVLLNAILQVFGHGSSAGIAAVLIFSLIGWGWKAATWRHNDGLGMPTTLNSATGLAGGSVRSVEWPHTEENYLLKEMGFQIARKHQGKMRLVTQVFAFAMPAILLLLGLLVGGAVAAIVSVLAALSQLAGLLVERWLFFAEAKHTVTLYYGRA